MDLVRRLNKLGKEVEGAYGDINWGGCCVFASLVAARLLKYAPVQIRVGNEWMDDDGVAALDDVRPHVQTNSVTEWNSHNIFFTHIVLEFEWKGKTYHYDTEGAIKARPTTKIGNYPIIEGSLTLQEAEELADSHGWNTKFNRKNIPKIKAIINAAFDRMDKHERRA